MNRHLALLIGAFTLALTTLASNVLAAPSVLPDFVIENAVAGVRFNTPTAIAFTSDRMLVAEKGGVVWVVKNGAKLPLPMWSGIPEVLNNGDRGLIGLAVDPQFEQNGFIYLLYTVDPDSNNIENETASFGRLTRYRVKADDPNRVDPTSRTILIGARWADGFVSATLSHGVAALQWGRDGSLLVSCGDGGHYDRLDAGGHDPNQFLPGRSDTLDDLGSYRAQSLHSLSGKVLRVNPSNGAGYTSNPFYDGDPWSARSRVWAYGMRNPFRFCVRPGTGDPDSALGRPGTLYIGDVGLNLWEEVDVTREGGANLGWPNYEGKTPQPIYASYPQPLYGMESFGTPSNPSPHTLPTFAWHHNDSTLSEPHGVRGNCTAGGAFYTGGLYPPHYRGRYFFSDFGRGWLRVALMDSTDRVVQLQDFATGLEGPVDWATDPASGDVHYVSIYTGEVRRLRYVGSNGAALPPVARASANPNIGAAPATIAFSSLGSYDPAGEPVSFTWNFGDGDHDGSSHGSPTHVFQEPGEYQVILTISTPRGAVARDTVAIVITTAPGFPSTGIIDSLGGPDRPLGSPWGGALNGLRISSRALMQTASTNQAIWNGGTFGANQEVYVRFDSVGATAIEQDLLLKVQGLSWNTGAIQVVYNASQSVVVMTTYTPGVGWQRRGGPWTVRFEAGDVFGARAYSNGTVQIYRNGTPFGIASVEPWPFAGSGGRIGVMLRDAPTARLVDFGGGTVAVRTNTPPVVNITAPIDGSFYVDDQTVELRMGVSDAEDATTDLAGSWSVDLIHNNHTHPNVFLYSTQSAEFPALSHDDGTGVHYQIRAFVADRGGLSDTTLVSIYPEVDLQVSAVKRSSDPSETFFVLRNLGRMPSPPFHWVLLAGSTARVEGDTLLAGLDSARIVVTLPAPPPEGFDLRVVVDTLAQVHEVHENNNAVSQHWMPTVFPTTQALDTFEGPDGALAAPWVGSIAGLRVAGGALVQTSPSSYGVWNQVFGPDQEAYIELDAITAASPEHDLLLKVQGVSWNTGAIQVVYSATVGQVKVYTYDRVAGWKLRGGPWAQRFEPGDQFGARAFPDGRVRVHRNGMSIGETTLGNWPFASSGGRVGLMLKNASASRISSFGGGAVPNHPPSAEIVSPTLFYVAGQSVEIQSSATDVEDSTSSLAHHWDLVGWSGPTLAAENAARNAARVTLAIPPTASGVLGVRLVVTDTGAQADTVMVSLYPEVDLEASSVTRRADPREAMFTLRNRGRMPSSAFHWAVLAGATIVAEGDTVIAALDSARIVRTLLPPHGGFELRLVVDTLAQVTELDEDNNASLQLWMPAAFPTTATLDGFQRADASLAAPWIGSIGGLRVADRALVQTSPSSYAVWNQVFGPDQEAFIHLDAITATAPEHDLLLKVQGTTWTAGAIQVVYSAVQGRVKIYTYAPGAGWKQRGGPWAQRFEAGDQFGARAFPDGRVRVYRNGVEIAATTVGDWPFATAGGRVGLILHQAHATRIGRFGGGTVSAVPLVREAIATTDRAVDPAVASNQAVESFAGLPARIALSSPRPNPSFGEVFLALELPRSATVSLAVYDVTGRLVWSAPVAEREAGRTLLSWPGVDSTGTPARAGMYLARVQVGGQPFTRTISLLR